MYSRSRLVIMGFIVLVLAMLACGSRTNTGNQGNADTQRPTKEAATPAPTEAPPAAAIGQDVIVGDVRWKVLEAKDLGKELKADNEFTQPKNTSGKFILIRFEVENRKSEAATYAGINLLDGKGRKFEPYGERMFFLPQEETCVLEQLNPNLTKVCAEIFELPGDAANLNALLGDLDMFGGKESQVALGF